MQAVLLLVAWIHGCIGIYFWLRLQRLFPKMALVLLGLAVLLPVLAVLGFYQQGRTIELLAQQPEWRAQTRAPARIGTAAERDNLIRLRDYFLIFYAAAIALVFAARGVRLINERRGGMIRLTYPDRAIRVPKGLTVLEASYRHHVPHANSLWRQGTMFHLPDSDSERPERAAAAFGSRSFSSSESVRVLIRPYGLHVSCDHREISRSSHCFRRRWARHSCTAKIASTPAKSVIS